MAADRQAHRLTVLTPFARRMSIMIGTGIPLVRALAAAEESESSPGMAAAIREVRGRIEQGETMSQAMGQQPEWFDRLALSMVRAGEVGGVLDETLRSWAEVLEWAVQVRERVALHRAVEGLVRARDWAGTDETEPGLPHVVCADPVLRASLFCYALGVMLQSGVPVLQALDVAAEGLDEGDARVVQAAGQALRDGQPDEPSRLHEHLAAVNGLDATAVGLLKVGEETGRLEEAALHVSDLLRWQAEHDALRGIFTDGQ